MKTVCAWCEKLIKTGSGPVSHGICERCLRREMTAMRIRRLRKVLERGVRGPADVKAIRDAVSEFNSRPESLRGVGLSEAWGAE